MAEVRLLGVQVPGPQYSHKAEIGALVSGVYQERHVVALFAHDSEGQHYIVLNDDSGKLVLAGDTGLTCVQTIEGELIIEPAEGATPFALPRAEADGSSLVVSEDGDIGLRVTVPKDNGTNGYWVVANSLKTGNPFGGKARFLLKNFRLLLKVEGRDEPLLIATY